MAAQLTDQPAHTFGLRLNVGLDNLFIIAYSAFFVLLAVRFRGLLSPITIGVALGALLLTALLDAVENHHILLMLHAFQHSEPVSAEQLEFQWSPLNLKFHASYLGAFLFAFGFYRFGGLGRVIARLLWLYVPLGMIAFAVPVEIVTPFALARTVFFILAFALAGIYFLRDKGAPQPRHQGTMRKKSPARAPEETRSNLVAAAAKLFNSVGYYGTNSNRIARQAGYAPGTFYVHFADKLEIFLEVYRGWVESEWQAIAATLGARPAAWRRERPHRPDRVAASPATGRCSARACAP